MTGGVQQFEANVSQPHASRVCGPGQKVLGNGSQVQANQHAGKSGPSEYDQMHASEGVCMYVCNVCMPMHV